MSQRDSVLPSDRIFVTNHMREIEIGAYAEEHGVTQRVRFDITLEIGPGPLPAEDDYMRVVNYEDLVAAIDRVTDGPRINLLETFAERLAEIILADPCARRVHIRIEKPDRLPGGGTYGIEIVRQRDTLG